MYQVEVFAQQDMDELIQAAVYIQDKESYIPHQDRPYVVNIHKALYIKKIPLERIYCCGVFGLPADTKPVVPAGFRTHTESAGVMAGRTVILSPYAKSVTALPDKTALYPDCNYCDTKWKAIEIYALDGMDTVLSGALEYLAAIPAEDKIVILTSRTDEYRQMTLDFLAKNHIRYDAILFNMPMGERIVVNDRKPSGLDMAVALNMDRDCFGLPEIVREE